MSSSLSGGGAHQLIGDALYGRVEIAEGDVVKRHVLEHHLDEQARNRAMPAFELADYGARQHRSHVVQRHGHGGGAATTACLPVSQSAQRCSASLRGSISVFASVAAFDVAERVLQLFLGDFARDAAGLRAPVAP